MNIEEKEEIRELLVDDVTRADLDSDEELYFAWYLQDLKAAGIILDAGVAFKPIELSMKIEHGFDLLLKKKSPRKRSHVFNPTIYTPDFYIIHNPEYRDSFYSLFCQGKQFPGQKIPFLTSNPAQLDSIIEVKGDMDMHRTKGQTMVKIKWVFEKHQCYIQLVTVPDIFRDTFTPEKFIARERFTKEAGPKGKKKTVNVLPPKINWPVKTIDQYKEELDKVKTKMKEYHGQTEIDVLSGSDDKSSL